MKKVECKMCGGKSFYCRTGKHEPKAGQVHSGRGAICDAQWDCPNCCGRGFILLSILDRIALAFYVRGDRVYTKTHPRR